MLGSVPVCTEPCSCQFEVVCESTVLPWTDWFQALLRSAGFDPETQYYSPRKHLPVNLKGFLGESACKNWNELDSFYDAFGFEDSLVSGQGGFQHLSRGVVES
jgi:hypothetical protein